jgi:hypothetical protein
MRLANARLIEGVFYHLRHQCLGRGLFQNKRPGAGPRPALLLT